ncbi:TonB-dependent receptor plug domain-containing protein [Peristeroidobacter soli]|uniref:TonB-dependent receptor plug domain-containing protein n=1 Tax=Peristeroidobacter soli TaxID=2497877 RepID=UPI0015891D69|nr:TonB-dependent receptor [Peristeroidobacter soli]
MNDRSAARSGARPLSVAVRRALGPASALLALTSFVAMSAMAQDAEQATAQMAQAGPQPEPQSQTGAASSDTAAASDTLEAITVTGSRIARVDGYEAPTPVSVLGAEDLNKMATTTIADSVNRLPAFANSQTPRNRSSNISSGTAGVNVLNLRGLGGNRTLVLQDGKRMVASALGTGGNASAVDVNSIPSGLVQRVEVVTGGASAVYGSDALAGVVNFILDKDFTGVKGNVDGGITEAGDGQNYKLTLTTGTKLFDDRLHLLFSGEYADDKGIIGNDRSWANDSFQMMNNPAYNAITNPTVPQLLTVHNAGVANGTYGGLILSCQRIAGTTISQVAGCGLRGTQFVDGGQPIPFQFGPLVNGPTMSGGDWEASRIDRATTIALPLQRRSLFGRASVDITDNINGYVELQYAKTKSHNTQVVPILNNGGVFIYSGNPFIPESVQAAMTANGIDRFEVGTFNGDMHYLQGINERELKRGVLGFEGSFPIGSRDWNWDAAYTHSEQGVESWTPTNRVNANYNAAINAMIDPATGNVVCGPRNPATLVVTVDPNCRPYNPMGLGVNSAQVIDYITDTGHSDLTLKQQVWAASMSGEPFDNWAGPVSTAFGIEHRKESVDGEASALDEANAFFAGNYHATIGEYDVTEAFLETVFPLLKDVPGAEQLDFNGAVRYTDYSTSGEVTTWKAGATWTPIQDVRFRFTQSRDIRAPGLGELYNRGASGTGNNIDRGLPGNPTYFMLSRTNGNPDLKPEQADTTGIGVVLSPRFLPGFTMSVDYYKIDVEDSIATLGSRQIIDGCYLRSQADLCSLITRDPVTNQIAVITSQPLNIIGQTASGIDVDATYNFPVGPGNVSLRAMASFIDKLETVTSEGLVVNGKGVNSDDAGISLDSSALTAPKYRYLLSAGYDIDPVQVTLTMRGISSGVYNNAFIECDANCPTGTALPAGYSTIGTGMNHIDSAQYFDLAFNYKLENLGELYFVVENLLDEDPAKVAGGRGAGFYQGQSNVTVYDRFGRMFHAGMRFQF